MNVLSEKERYTPEFLDFSEGKPYDMYLWGEELIDKTIVVYKGKIKDIPDYNSFKDYLINSAIVVMDFSKKDYMRFTSTRFNPASNCIYITDAVFDSCWHALKKSVRLGIQLANDKGESIEIVDGNEIVDLTYLKTVRKNAFINKDKICFEGIEISEEEKRLQSRRQSLLAKVENKYYFSSVSGYVHDKKCDEVMNIKLEEFAASETIPEDRELCPICKRRILLRIACAPYVKQIPACDLFLKKAGVSTDRLEALVFNDKMKFDFKSESEFYVKHNEDTFMIDGSNIHSPKLFHNNYTVIDDNKRIIGSGFHRQKIEAYNLNSVINYIEFYSWEKHLEAVKVREEALVEAKAPVTEVIEVKENIFVRIFNRIKGLFATLSISTNIISQK